MRIFELSSIAAYGQDPIAGSTTRVATVRVITVPDPHANDSTVVGSGAPCHPILTISFEKIL
jgi:hypothetical protein